LWSARRRGATNFSAAAHEPVDLPTLRRGDPRSSHCWQDWALTLWGAGLYLGARTAYLPLYAAGFYLIRSLVWNVATRGIGLILLALWR
jgi:hypothetical protein